MTNNDFTVDQLLSGKVLENRDWSYPVTMGGETVFMDCVIVGVPTLKKDQRGKDWVEIDIFFPGLPGITTCGADASYLFQESI